MLVQTQDPGRTQENTQQESRSHPLAVNVTAALDALNAGFGAVFDVAFTTGTWRAVRRDGTGSLISALNPGDLAVRMRAAWNGGAW
jgi:hypothetical protein